MSLQMNVKIVGGRELEKALKDLGVAAGQKGGPVKLALRAAAKPVLKTAQLKAAQHTKTGVLLASLKIKRHPNPRFLNEIQGVGFHSMGKRPKKGERQNTGKPWYAQIVEYGGRGKQGPLKGFLRVALETNRTKSTSIFTAVLTKGIKRIAKKISKENAAKVEAKAR